MRSSLAAARQSEVAAVLAGSRGCGERPEGILLGIPSSELPLPALPLLTHLRATLGQRPFGDPAGGAMHFDGALCWFRETHPQHATYVAMPSLARQRFAIAASGP